MKQIKVSDEVHEVLTTQANMHYRTIGGQIEYLISLDEEKPGNMPAASNAPSPARISLTDVYANTPPEKMAKYPDPRAMTQAEIKAERARLYEVATNMRKELDEELSWNQDPESKAIQQREGEERIKLVWDEFHALGTLLKEA